MATYIKGLTDLVPQVQPFQPDFNMIQKTLSTMQSRYDQGFAAVKSAYNQVLNAPLTDNANRVARGDFLKMAEDKLKGLSSVDLSLPENQAAAEKVFSPFWEDEMMLQDASLTKSYNDEITKAYSFRDSKDEKVRSQYSDVAVRYLQNGLEKLSSAGRNKDNYAQLEKRRFVPFENLESYLNEQAQKAGLKIEWTGSNGPYMVSITNGTQSVPAFETFADNMLGNNFKEQFQVMGTVEKEERIRQLKHLHPLLTDADALSVMSSDVTHELKSGMTRKQNTLDTSLGNVKTKITEYEKMSALNPGQETAYQDLLRQRDQLSEQSSAAKDALTAFTKDEEKTRQNILDNPDGYFSRVMKQRTVDGWAQARASNQQTKLDINPVWKENNSIDYNRQQLALEQKKFELDEKRYDLEKWKAEHPTKLLRNADGSYSENPAYQDPEQSGHYEGAGTTDVTKVGNPYQTFMERQQQRWDFAHNQIFDINKGVGSILSSMNVADADAVRYMDMMKTLSNDPKSKFLDKDWEFFRTIGQKLKDKTGIDAGTGFFNARASLLEASKMNLADKLKDGGTGMTKDDVSMLVSYTAATQALQEHDSLEKKRQELVNTLIKNDPTTYKNILISKDGKSEISTAEDISKEFRSSYTLYNRNGDDLTLTPRQLAEAYISGKLRTDHSDGSGVEYDGHTYGQIGLKIKPGKQWSLQMHDIYQNSLIDDIEHLEDKYGKSEGQKNLRDKVNQEVVPNLPEYQNQTGKMGFVVRYDLSDKDHGSVAGRLINEISNPANREGIYVDNKLSTNDDANNAIVSLASLREPEMKKYVSSALINPVGINGRPSLQIVFNPMKSNDKTNANDAAIAPLAGKTIEVDLNPNPTGETLQKIRYNAGYYIYGSLLRGEPMVSDPMLKSAGFSFELTPDSTKDPRGAIVKINRKEFKNGKYIDAPQIRDAFSFSQKNPDEIVGFLYDLFQQNLVKNLTAQTQYTQQNKTAFRTPQQIKDEYESGKLSGTPHQ